MEYSFHLSFSLSFSLSLSSPAEVPRAAFSSLAHIINRIHELKLVKDKHGADAILSSYIQFVFSTPQGPGNTSAFDPRLTVKNRSSSLLTEEAEMKRSASLRTGKHSVHVASSENLSHTHTHIITIMLLSE